MFPTFLTLGSFSLSSFGVFLALAFLFGVFLMWRLARAWDLDEEKVLDLTLLTFFGGLIEARLYFGITNFSFFVDNPLRLILFTKYPGFSFWGGFLGGWLTLYFFTKRKRLDFWQIADIAAVGFLAGLIISDLGCFLGGCGVGAVTQSFLGVSMVGLVGKRWPVQLFEAIALSLVLLNVYPFATHFHLRGKIISISLIFIGFIKLILLPFRDQKADFIFSATILILGVTIFYRISKRNIILDLKDFVKFLLKPKLVLGTLKKGWYNQQIKLAWRFRNLKKNLRRLNVRFSPKNNKIY